MREHKVLSRVKVAMGGGPVYDPPLDGVLVFTDTKGNERRYGVQLHAEHDGVWIAKHSRPSGTWARKDRVIKATTGASNPL